MPQRDQDNQHRKGGDGMSTKPMNIWGTLPMPPEPHTIAEMIPVRLAEIKARNAKPRCRIKGHGAMKPRPLESQTYEQMWCGVWYDCQAFNGNQRCGNGASYPSRELAAFHGEPYNVDGEHFETWTGSEWQPVSKAEVEAHWAARAAERDRRQAEMERAARSQRRSRKAATS